MNTKHLIILLFTLMATLFALLTACDKLDPEIPEGEGSYKEGNVPEISVGNATGIDYTSASVPVTVLSTGGRKITQLALCFSSATANPTIEDMLVELGEVNIDEKDFRIDANLTDLTHNTTYNYRAYAINTEGEAYSSSNSFTTLLDDRLPQVTTNPATEITATSAGLNGRLTSMGDATTISQHGFVWATHSNPGLSDNNIELGTLNAAPADFNSTIENLNINTTYYYKAYAVNSYSTTFGPVVTFNTLTGEISLTTAEVTNITANSATSGGNITDDGGMDVTARGVCWSTSPNPTTNNEHTSDGTGTGTWESEINNLESNTTYYVRAYATNNMGSYYGEQKDFTTGMDDGPGQAITDIDGNTYETVWIGGQNWMAENLKTTTYSNGTPIELVTDNEAWAALTSDAYCWNENDESQADLGALYNFYTAETGNLCPNGWHVPTDEEWKSLEMYLGMSREQADSLGPRGNNEGSKLAAGSWAYDELRTNSEFGISGFNAIPSGRRVYQGGFATNTNSYARWWTSTKDSEGAGYNRSIMSSRKTIYRGAWKPVNREGNPIRCIKD